jgi:hypothetical protein
MKKLILFLCVAGIAAFAYKNYSSKPKIITDPTYMEVHTLLEVRGRGDVEFVAFAALENEAECQKGLKAYTDGINKMIQAAKNGSTKSAECKPALPPRYARLFDDEPVRGATYLRVGKNSRMGSEIRILTWGLTLDESNQFCDMMAADQKADLQKGAVSCVRGTPIQ